MSQLAAASAQRFSDNTDPLLDTAQAAIYLGLKKKTLANWRTKNRFPELTVTRIGRSIKYRKSVLDVFIANRTDLKPAAEKAGE